MYWGWAFRLCIEALFWGMGAMYWDCNGLLVGLCIWAVYWGCKQVYSGEYWLQWCIEALPHLCRFTPVFILLGYIPGASRIKTCDKSHIKT